MPGRSDGGNTRQITESDLEDLRNKFHLLEGDRKAYYEMSMHTMKSNKALVAQLRAENKEVRRALASIQRERATSSKAGTTVDEEEETEMEREVNRLRKMCNQFTNKAACKSFLFFFSFSFLFFFLRFVIALLMGLLCICCLLCIVYYVLCIVYCVCLHPFVVLFHLSH